MDSSSDGEDYDQFEPFYPPNEQSSESCPEYRIHMRQKLVSIEEQNEFEDVSDIVYLTGSENNNLKDNETLLFCALKVPETDISCVNQGEEPDSPGESILIRNNNEANTSTLSNDILMTDGLQASSSSECDSYPPKNTKQRLLDLNFDLSSTKENPSRDEFCMDQSFVPIEENDYPDLEGFSSDVDLTGSENNNLKDNETLLSCALKVPETDVSSVNQGEEPDSPGESILIRNNNEANTSTLSNDILMTDGLQASSSGKSDSYPLKNTKQRLLDLNFDLSSTKENPSLDEFCMDQSFVPIEENEYFDLEGFYTDVDLTGSENNNLKGNETLLSCALKVPETDISFLNQGEEPDSPGESLLIRNNNEANTSTLSNDIMMTVGLQASSSSESDSFISYPPKNTKQRLIDSDSDVSLADAGKISQQPANDVLDSSSPVKLNLKRKKHMKRTKHMKQIKLSSDAATQLINKDINNMQVLSSDSNSADEYENHKNAKSSSASEKKASNKKVFSNRTERRNLKVHESNTNKSKKTKSIQASSTSDKVISNKNFNGSESKFENPKKWKKFGNKFIPSPDDSSSSDEEISSSDHQCQKSSTVKYGLKKKVKNSKEKKYDTKITKKIANGSTSKIKNPKKSKKDDEDFIPSSNDSSSSAEESSSSDDQCQKSSRVEYGRKKTVRKSKEKKHDKKSNSVNLKNTQKKSKSNVSRGIDSSDSEVDDKVKQKTPEKTSSKDYSYERAEDLSTSQTLDVRERFVPESSEGGKYYVKKNCCPYCHVLRVRLDQHLWDKHMEQKTVYEAWNLPEQSARRRELLSTLRREGNAYFNQSKSLNPEGKIIAVRRLAKNRGKPIPQFQKKNETEATSPTNKNTSTDDPSLSIQESIIKKTVSCTLTAEEQDESKKLRNDLVAVERVMCIACKGYFSFRTIARHIKEKHPEAEDMTTRSIMAVARRATLMVHYLSSPRMRDEILPYLNDDLVGNLCRIDKLIVIYGNQYSERHFIRDQDDLVRAQLRYLAKFLLQMRRLDATIKDLESCFRGRHYDKFLECTKIMSGYNKDTNLLQHPAVANTLGMLFRRLLDVLKAQYSKEEDTEKLGKLSIFQAQFDNSFSTTFASKIAMSQNIAKRDAPKKKLPSTQDIQVLEEYLKRKLQTCIQYLESKYDFQYWLSLLEVLMLKTLVFNRRRPGETDRTKVIDFHNRIKCTDNNEVDENLLESDNKQLEKYEKMEMKGKKINGIDGTVYLAKSDVKGFQLLLKYRKTAGILKNNDYLFALPNPYDPNRTKHASAYRVQVKLVKECDEKFKKLKNPEALKSTLLRKHCATKFSTMNQKEDFEHLTRHLAHTSQIHKSHYQKSTRKIDANVTRILEKVNNDAQIEDSCTSDSDQKDESSKDESQQLLEEPELLENIKKQKKSKQVVKEKSPKTRWTSREKEAFDNAFSEDINRGRHPDGTKIKKAMKKFPCLKERGIERIRAQISNYLKKKKLV